jgi:hypothetical protein
VKKADGARDESYLDEYSLEELKQQEESESEEEVEYEKKQLSSYGSTNESTLGMRGVSFRNSSKTISRILGE